MKSPLPLVILAMTFCLTACVEGDLSPGNSISVETFAGRWENINAQTNSLYKITITQKVPGQVSVQLWRACGQGQCNLGNYTSTINDLQDGKISLSLNWNDQPIGLALSLYEGGKLLVSGQEEADRKVFEDQFFSRPISSSFFQQIDIDDARSVSLARLRISGSNNELNFLRPGTILIFQTNEGRYGKIQIRGNDDILTMRWRTWDLLGEVYEENDYLPLKGNAYYDMDLGQEDTGEAKSLSDFLWIDKGRSQRWLEPINTALIAVYHLG